MDINKLHFETRQIHGGLHPDQTGSRGVAIYPTAAYEFKSCDHAAKLFTLEEGGNIYTRLNNPTVAAYEERIAALYGAVGAVATASGMSAIFLTIVSLAHKGQNIVASPALYGGTYNLFRVSLANLGVDVRIADSLSADSFARLIDDSTRLLFVESMGNPTCVVPDIEALAGVAHAAGVPLVVDNTFGAGGYLCNPFEWGADIVVDSATKWINGHGTALGGIIVDGGRFDWGNGRYPEIDGPSEGYHGLNLYDAFGRQAFAVKCRVDALRDFGPCASAFDAYLMLLGLETLSLRADHEVRSAFRVAEWLRGHPLVESVDFVGFEENASHGNAARYFRHGASSVFSATLKCSVRQTVKFIEALELAKNMTMIGDSVTVVTHPASTTHSQLGEDDMAAAGVSPGLLRISLGLENVEDIIADFSQALEKTRS